MHDWKVDVSVIIPIYNDERFIGECIDSVRKQTDVAVEIICIDDGSTDGSAGIIRQREMMDRRVCLAQQDHLGPGAARNRGMDLAHGRYVAFLDSDDFYLDGDALSNLVRFADEKALFMVGAKFFEDHDGKLSWRKNQYGVTGIQYDGRIYDYKSQLQKVKYGFTTFLFSLEMLKRYGIKFPSYLRNEDPVFLVKALYYADQVAFLDVRLYGCRKYLRADRNANDRAITSIVAGSREIIEFAARHDLKELFEREMDTIEYGWSNLILNLFNLHMMEDLLKISNIAKTYAGMERMPILDRIVEIVRSGSPKRDVFSQPFHALLASSQSFYLYGAGTVTHQILAYASGHDMKNRIKKIFVSEEKNNPDQMDGIPVAVFDAAAELSREIPVVIAVGANFTREIMEKLTAAGVTNIITLSDADKTVLRKASMG